MTRPTPFWKTTWFRVTLGTLVSIVFLALAIKDVPLGDVAQTLARVNYVWVALGVLGMIVQSGLRAVRWIQLYYPQQRGLRILPMTSIVLIAQMLNIVVPWRVGEIARIYLASEIEKRNAAQTLATLAIEKFFDTLMLLTLLLMLPPFMTLPSWLERPREGIIVLALALFGVAFALVLSEEWLVQLLTKIPLPWGKQFISANVRIALTSLDVFKRWDLHLALQAQSVTLWLLGIVINYLTFLAMDLQLPFISAFLLMAVLQVGGIVPSSPGKLGVFQYLCILTLGVFGVDKSAGLTYGILLYLIAYGTPIILGVLCLWWGGVNLRRMTAPPDKSAA